MKLWPNLMKIKDYVPEDRHFTSMEEMKYIKDTLNFKEATEDDLYNYRTMTVMMWGELRDDAKEEKKDDIWNAMMSITSVIDQEMWSRGEEV